jgi:hypothetical protein
MTFFPKTTAFALAVMVLFCTCQASHVEYDDVSTMPGTKTVAQNILTKLLTNACKKYAELPWLSRKFVTRMLGAFDDSGSDNLLVFLKNDCTVTGADDFYTSLTESAQETLEEEVTADDGFVSEQMELFTDASETSLLRDIASEICTHDVVRGFIGNTFDSKFDENEISDIACGLSEDDTYQPLFEKFRAAIVEHITTKKRSRRPRRTFFSDETSRDSSDCRSCDGRKYSRSDCESCKGTGEIETALSYYLSFLCSPRPCTDCDGTGNECQCADSDEPCDDCICKKCRVQESNSSSTDEDSSSTSMNSSSQLYRRLMCAN